MSVFIDQKQPDINVARLVISESSNNDRLPFIGGLLTIRHHIRCFT